MLGSYTHHSVHHLHEAPERQRLVRTSDNIKGGAEVRHALHIPFATYTSALTLPLRMEKKDGAPKSFS